MAYQTKFDGSCDKAVTLGAALNPTSLEGYFLGSKETPDKGYGPGKLHIFQTKEGTVGVWGKTRLNNLLTKELVGQMCLVNFTGMIEPSKKGKRPSYGYKVQHDPDNTVVVDAVESTDSYAESSDEDYSDARSEDSEVEEAYTPPPAKTAPKASAPVVDEARRQKFESMINKNRPKTA